jgi:amino acid transporter
MTVLDVLLGRRLANREYGTRKIGAFEGIPSMGLDGFASSAYGPEAALTILAPLGAASLSLIGWVIGPIVALLFILYASYWQTIRAYPNNGGAYIVAKENLGANASLLAAAALMVDYVLNVAVAISAGVAALVSAVPALQPATLPLCLGILALITLVNLRGTLEAGRALAVPTYLFVVCFAVILAVGFWKAALAHGAPAPVTAPPPLPQATESVGLWLVLRAFASGCTAMTGVEAVSNGMSAFRDPAPRYGHRTLSAIVLVLAVLLGGIAYLAQAYHLVAMDQTQPGYRSVLAQLTGAVMGDGAFYYVTIAAVLAVLCLSANTSFVDFPRLCRMVAEDGYLPRAFAIAGRRLVFSAGMVYLAAAAGLLLFVFDGITDRLIPLFAIGAFLTFTLSQAGMVVHWRRATSTDRARRTHLAVNALGASVTAVALAIILVAKFTEGAWITLLAIPGTILLLRAIRRYYDTLEARLEDDGPLRVCPTEPPIVLVATEDWNRATDKGICLAMRLSPDVMAVHLTQLSGPEVEEHDRNLRSRWRTQVETPARAAGLKPPKLEVLRAEYRAIHEPLLKLIAKIATKVPDRPILVMIPEIVKQRWYQHILHTDRARTLRAELLRHDAQLAVVIVPWSLTEIDGR